MQVGVNMLKYYSTITNQFYETEEKAFEEERKYNESAEDSSKPKTITESVDEIIKNCLQTIVSLYDCEVNGETGFNEDKTKLIYNFEIIFDKPLDNDEVM